MRLTRKVKLYEDDAFNTFKHFLVKKMLWVSHKRYCNKLVITLDKEMDILKDLHN